MHSCKISKFGLLIGLTVMKALKYIFSLVMITVALTAFGQETKMVKNRKKMLEKQEEQKKKAQEEALEEGKKRHMNIQSKSTKKRMKQNMKKSKAVNRKRSGEKKSFFARIFGGK